MHHKESRAPLGGKIMGGGVGAALCSRRVKLGVGRNKTPLEGEHDQANDDRLN